MIEEVKQDLQEEFFARYLAAWPERDDPIALLREAMCLWWLVDEHGDRSLCVHLWGSWMNVALEDYESVDAAVTALAADLADQSEGDRWEDRGGWRDWRNPD
ncbi:MAG: hypothetical protein AB7V43_14965 [Acidimicrobiia bacterium]